MPEILTDWELALDADAVLRGQGADPALLRSRKPRLFDIAVQALDEAGRLFSPKSCMDATRSNRSCMLAFACQVVVNSKAKP